MSEKRYFYTDPLAAAWQAKHFGMKFQVRYNHFDGVQTGVMTLSELLNFAGGKEFPLHWLNGFYIHPDSVKLLEPHAGTAIEASVAYEEMAKKLHGEFYRPQSSTPPQSGEGK